MEGGWKTKGRVLRRQEIVEAALELFSQNGFHGTTMARIAHRAGVGVGTLYQHFQGKEDLYLSLLEERCHELLDILKKEASRGGGIKEVLDRLLEADAEFVERHRSFFKLYMSEQLATLEAVRERLGVRADRLYGEFFQLFQGVMEQGIKRGDLKDLPAPHLARAFMGLLNSFFFDWLKGRVENLKSAKETIIVLFLEGAQK
jgi:AcrR family transcriptional regulator